MEAPPPTASHGPHVHFSGFVRKPIPRALPPLRRPVSDPPPADEDGGLDFMRELLSRAGLDAARYRSPALRRRLAACLRALGASSVEEGRRRLRDQPQKLSAALDAVLLGVTEFFRDREVFAWLEREGLPWLLGRNPHPRCWSAACSSGQELYSVALMLEDAGALDGAELLGTDIRPSAVRSAGAGLFAAEPEDALGGRLRNRFGPGPVWKAPTRLRSRTRWRCRDLLTSVEPGPWDLILWRNMAIYLDPAAAHGLWHRMAGELQPGGVLISGKAEVAPRELRLIRLAPSIYLKPCSPA